MIANPNEQSFHQAIRAVLTRLSATAVAYCIEGTAALYLQGMRGLSLSCIEVTVQWDGFQRVYDVFSDLSPSPVDENVQGAQFTALCHCISVIIRCRYNTVVAADVDRIQVDFEHFSAFVKAVDFYVRHRPADGALARQIDAFMADKQRTMRELNEKAWNQEDAYLAWVKRFGEPEEAAKRILKNPGAKLSSLEPYLGDVTGKTVMNLMGSHGTKAVACALLGADVTVVDMSEGNRRYAEDLAKSTGVSIRYVVSDVLDLPESELCNKYDVVFMELGILHYFLSLHPLFRVVAGLLHPGGRFVLQDFHPVSTKLITSKGKKHKVTGNYFDPSITATLVAYGKYMDDSENGLQPTVYLRKWTLGEVVTAVAESGLTILALREEPNTKADDFGIPKTFTIAAIKH
jgi:2-polyprenyl-3-methyl-5-hydroxy-6-metoxy-1,4-benzoquinol methylase